MVHRDHDGYDCDYDEDDIVNDPAFMKKSNLMYLSGCSSSKDKEVTVHVDKY